MPTIDDFPFLARPMTSGGTSTYTESPYGVDDEQAFTAATADPWVMPGTLCPPGSSFDLATMSCRADLQPGSPPPDPSGSPGTAPGELPPMGDDPVYGYDCSVYNMDPMQPNDPAALAVAAGAGLPFTYNKFPFCTPKSGTPAPPSGGYPQPAPAPQLPGYISDEEHDEAVASLQKERLIWAGVSFVVGGVVGGVVGYSVKKGRKRT